MTDCDILVLFDIDGTILHPGAGARQSMSQALFEETQQNIEIVPGYFAGKTDILIVTDLLTKTGCLLQEMQTLLQSVLKRYIELMKVNYNAKGDAHLYKGVRELIDKLQVLPNVYLGLLTGNIEEGARIKLEPFNLNEAFPVGAFGDDGFLRTDLARIAVLRSEAHYGMNFPKHNVVVIGDTVEDIKCGKAIQARTIAVSQHLRNKKELNSMNPDHVFIGFEHTTEIVNAIFAHNDTEKEEDNAK